MGSQECVAIKGGGIVQEERSRPAPDLTDEERDEVILQIASTLGTINQRLKNIEGSMALLLDDRRSQAQRLNGLDRR